MIAKNVSTGRRSRMVAPKITFQQLFILLEIDRGSRRGKAIREALEREGMRQHSATFSICMRRMKEAGLVAVKEVKASGGARGRERAYSLTAAGRAALREVRDFCRRVDLSGE